MRARMSFAILVFFALAVAGGFFARPGNTQEAPKKGKQPIEQPYPTPKTAADQPGQPGGEDDIDTVPNTAPIDSAIQRMTVLVQQSQALSKSFANLATLHEGADRGEILVMQRMSDATAAMAGEIKMSLQQYKKMLNDETASDTGSMRSEVQGLKSIMDGLAREIDDAVQTLQALQGQMGQG